MSFIQRLFKYIGFLFIAGSIIKLISILYIPKMEDFEFMLFFLDNLPLPTYFLFDEYFLLTETVYYILLQIAFTAYIIRRPPLKSLGDYSGWHTIKSFIYAIEMFLIFTSMFALSVNVLFGQIGGAFLARNFLGTILLLHLINLVGLEYFQRRFNSTRGYYWKSFGVQILLIGGMIFPDIFLGKISIEIFVGLALIIFLNPTLFHYFKNYKIVTIFDYLFLVQVFTFLHL
jgi:hypothetical protein